MDISGVYDMSHVFEGFEYDVNVSLWNVNNITDVSYMFNYSNFNGDISNWDVSNVTDKINMCFLSAIDEPF